MTSHSAIWYGEQELGDEYVFGAENPDAGLFDCSGLVQYAYRKAGYKLPRTAEEQYKSTQRISEKQAVAGDLVYFLDSNGHAYHTGIYLGDGKFLEAPHSGTVVKIASVNVNKVSFGRVTGYQAQYGRQAAADVAQNPADYESYGYVQDLANSVPEIKTLLKKASAGGWDAARFQDALQTTKWWKTNADSAKKMIALSKADPAEYKQQEAQAQAHVQQIADGMGVKLSGAQIRAQATADLYQGLDDATAQSDIGQLYGGSAGLGQGGTAVTLTAQIKQLASQYGVPVTSSWVQNQVRSALMDGTGAEGATAALTSMASSLFPALKEQLKAGQTTTDIAQPYIAAMSSILEIPDTQINLNDPTLKAALQGAPPAPAPITPTSGGQPKLGGPGGVETLLKSGAGGAQKAPAPAPANAVPTTLPLDQFENQLRADPRWQTTDNAKQSAYSMLHSLGQTFGFAS